MTSACLGVALNASLPKRLMSNRLATVLIISMAQQARPKVSGQSEPVRAQLSRSLTLAIITLPPFSILPNLGVALSCATISCMRLGICLQFTPVAARGAGALTLTHLIFYSFHEKL